MASVKTIVTVETANVKNVGGTAKANIKGVIGDLSFGSVFKSVLRTRISASHPGMEFILSPDSAAGGVGGRNVNDTGDRDQDIDSVNQGITASADSTGGFDGVFKVSANTHYMRFGFGSAYKHYINRSLNRSWIFVFDVTGNLPNGYLNLGSTEAAKNAWGWIPTNNYGTNASASVFNTRYFFNPHPFGHHSAHAAPLHSDQSTHSSGGTPTSMLTTTGSAGAVRRSVLMITYRVDGNVAFVRWKQTGDASGHSYIEGVTTPQTADWSASTYFAGYNVTAENGAVGAQFKYIGVVDQALSGSDFDVIADAAF